MFISRTTREERVTIETALDSAFLKIDQAERSYLLRFFICFIIKY